jgi:hypothetical protein
MLFLLPIFSFVSFNQFSYLNTHCFDYELWVVIRTITSTSTLSVLSDLSVVIVLNMFYTLIFLGHSLDLCSTLKQIIQG